MLTFRRSFRAITAALIVALGLSAPSAAAVRPYAERVVEAVLPNGLQMILLEDHKAPVAVFQLWYRVGSRDEFPGHTGLSHLLEHMMFKGTDRLGPEEYSRVIQRNGGRSNAFTSKDYTTYFATIASDRLGLVAGLEADRMAHLKINEELFTPERDVVKEERRLRTDDNPISALYELLDATAFSVHPYRHPVIGWMSDIDQLRVPDLLRHYEMYYAPNNAFVVAVGDFEASRLVAEIEGAFGAITTGRTPPAVRAVEPRQRGERRAKLRRAAQLPYVAIAYHVPNLESADGAALEVLSEILGGGKSTRLHRELVYRRRIARGAGAGYDYTSRDPNLFTLQAQPLPGKSSAIVEQALLEEIAKLRRRPPHAEEIRRAKNRIEAGFIFAQDSLFYQAFLLGRYAIAGDWRRIDSYLPAVRSVTGEDLLRVARFYFDSDNRTTAVLEPLPGSASGSSRREHRQGTVQQ